MRICEDCASCTGNVSLARSLGRTPEEVARLGGRCESCGHRWHRHEHGLAKSVIGPQGSDGIEFGVGEPPAGSPLAKLLEELGDAGRP